MCWHLFLATKDVRARKHLNSQTFDAPTHFDDDVVPSNPLTTRIIPQDLRPLGKKLSEEEKVSSVLIFKKLSVSAYMMQSSIGV